MPTSPAWRRGWLLHRRYAVPPETVALATERRLAGDWRGACAAAGVRIFDGDLSRFRYAAAIESDLRHLVPDLLRWHLPQPGAGSWTWYDRAAPLARYPDGSALMLREGPVVTVARSVPRGMLEVPRHMWDDRYTADLRAACGPAPLRPGGPCAHGAGPGAAAAEAAGVDVTGAPEYFLEQAWVWPRLVPAARALLERMHRGRPAGRRGEAVVGLEHNVYLDLRDERPRLRSGDPQTGGPPYTLRPVEWSEPLDAELLRHEYLPPDELHPLVHAALLPGRTQACPPAPAAAFAVATLPCSGATHRLVARDGALRALDHTDAELARELTLAALGGSAAPCAETVQRWRTGEGALPDPVQRLHDELWQRVHHGATDGVARLLEAGFPPIPDRGGATLLHALDRVDHERLLPVLLRLGLDVDARDGHGGTPLVQLVRRASCPAGLVRALLAAGADPRLRDDAGRDAFAYAASFPHLRAALAAGDG